MLFTVYKLDPITLSFFYKGTLISYILPLDKLYALDTLHPRYTVPSIYCTLDILYPRYTVPSIYCTLDILYPRYTAPSIYCTLDILYPRYTVFLHISRLSVFQVGNYRFTIIPKQLRSGEYHFYWNFSKYYL